MILVEVLVLALCAVMAGADGWDDNEDWGLENESILRQCLRLRNGIQAVKPIAEALAAA
jgi:hypothetical protein